MKYENHRERLFYFLVLCLATSFLFFSYMARFGYGVTLPRIIDELGITRAEAGLAYSLFILTYSAFSVASGRLFDRLGTRVVVVLSCVQGLGMVLVGLSPSYQLLVLSMIIAGLGCASSWTPMVAMVSSNLPASWRGRSVGILESGIRTSQGAVGLLVPVLVLAGGWRYAWLVLSVPLFAYGLLFYLLSRGRLGQTKLKGRRLTGYRHVLASGRFWFVGLSYSFMAFASYIILTFLADYLEREVGLPYVQASNTVSVMGFVGILGAVALTWLSDKVGRRLILAVSNVASAVCLFVLSKLPGDAFLVGAVVVIVAFYGVFFGALWPGYAACAGDIFPGSEGTVLGLWTLMLGVGSLASPIVGGLTADLTGSYGWSLVIGSLAHLVAMALLILGLRRQTNLGSQAERAALR
ncbi:MAG: MFS transporter [Candidatus Nezhaarchaeota archaeon]|nr:MFS transporter [Candidatus Nezhaarchaeota archaeon]